MVRYAASINLYYYVVVREIIVIWSNGKMKDITKVATRTTEPTLQSATEESFVPFVFAAKASR